MSVPPGKVTTQIVGASPEQEEILLESLSGVGDRRIEKVTVAKAVWGNRDGVGVAFKARPEAVKDMRTSWEASMIADAFAVRSRELGLPSVSYYGLPGFGTIALGDPGSARTRRGTEEKVKAFAGRLEEEAERAGAKVREIEVLRPLGYAMAVTLEVPDPAAFLDHRAPDFFEQLGDPPGDFDLRIVDSAGARVSEDWGAGSSGSVWVRKDLDGCSPYLVSRPMGYTPPPCPSG